MGTNGFSAAVLGSVSDRQGRDTPSLLTSRFRFRV